MKVFITGSTGFVGSYILRELLSRQHEVVALVRPGSASRLPLPEDKITRVQGDITDPDTYHPALQTCDAVIHLVGVIREFPRRGITYQKLHVDATRDLLRASEESCVAKFIHMSALGAHHGSASGYFHSKAKAEDLVRNSPLETTIFRPSIIFGPGDDFINYFANIIRRFHLIPIIGSGKYRMQPVHITNLSTAFVNSLETDQTTGQNYEIGGPDIYEFREMMEVIKSVLDTWAIPVYNPKLLMTGLAKLLQRFPFFPVTEDQIIMLYDENITDDDRIYRQLNITPIPFEAGIREYLGTSSAPEYSS
ncbi:MAG TPA: complex I NDUFA9 subunit family protein [bacterium]|nr:complex I NDUFA9 subunit family protein [bacterium]